MDFNEDKTTSLLQGLGCPASSSTQHMASTKIFLLMSAAECCNEYSAIAPDIGVFMFNKCQLLVCVAYPSRIQHVHHALVSKTVMYKKEEKRKDRNKERMKERKEGRKKERRKEERKTEKKKERKRKKDRTKERRNERKK